MWRSFTYSAPASVSCSIHFLGGSPEGPSPMGSALWWHSPHPHPIPHVTSFMDFPSFPTSPLHFILLPGVTSRIYCLHHQNFSEDLILGEPELKQVIINIVALSSILSTFPLKERVCWLNDSSNNMHDGLPYWTLTVCWYFAWFILFKPILQVRK